MMLSGPQADASGIGRFRGILFYDGECGLCMRLMRILHPALARAGVWMSPLQVEGASVMLGLPRKRLLDNIRFLHPDGQHLEGAEVFLHLTDLCAGWLRPATYVLRLPGIHFILSRIYRQVVRQRHCIGGACRLSFGHLGTRPARAQYEIVKPSGG